MQTNANKCGTCELLCNKFMSYGLHELRTVQHVRSLSTKMVPANMELTVSYNKREDFKARIQEDRKQGEQEGQKRGYASNQRRNGETHQQLQTSKLLLRAFWA